LKQNNKTKNFFTAGLLITIWVTGFATTAGGVWVRKRGKTSVQGVHAWNIDMSGKTRQEVEQALKEKKERFLHTMVTILAGPEKMSLSRRELGLQLDLDSMAAGVMKIGRKGSFWESLIARHRARNGFFQISPTFIIDKKSALQRMKALKEKIDHPAGKGRLNLRNRRVIPGKTGYRLNIHASLVKVLKSAQKEKTKITLAVDILRPKITEEVAEQLDISTVMGWFETEYKFKGSYEHRAHNLHLAARKLNGTVIMPKEVFSFNESLGPRTRQEGYRVAPVLAGGEKIDGIAGGTCQISSTLHAAAYFAGLDILEGEVHSQPSPYIELGLDAKVVWPDVDVKIRNQYKFPVVLHFEVAFGRVRAEILGKEKLYTIGFERSIVKQRPYKEIYRKDPDMELGKRKIEQRGEFGYHVRRRRVFFDENKNEIKAQYWTLVYPPTNLIVRLGEKPPEKLPEKPPEAPEASPPEDFPQIPPKPSPQRFVRIKQ